MKKLTSVILIFFLLGNSAFSINQPANAQSFPATYEPFGPFECLKGWSATSLCPVDFLETVICELENTNCWFDLVTHESTFQRGVYLLKYWDFIIANSNHVFNSDIIGSNLLYFNSLTPSEQSEIYALTICHINAEACYVDMRGALTIYQPTEDICETTNGKKWCYKPSDGAICQISPHACGGVPD